jgi:hypothetical protein
MRTISFIFLALTVALGGSPALGAEECTGITKELRATTLNYRASINEFRAAKSSLDVDATEEFRLRAHRRMVLAQRELCDHRGRLLELYEALVKGDCPPFDPNGLERTKMEFSRLENEEYSAISRIASLQRN